MYAKWLSKCHYEQNYVAIESTELKIWRLLEASLEEARKSMCEQYLLEVSSQQKYVELFKWITL